MPMWNNLVPCSEQGLFSSQVFCLTMLRSFPLRSGHYRRVPQYDDIPDWAGDFVLLGLVMYIIESNWITLTLTGNMPSHPFIPFVSVCTYRLGMIDLFHKKKKTCITRITSLALWVWECWDAGLSWFTWISTASKSRCIAYLQSSGLWARPQKRRKRSETNEIGRPELVLWSLEPFLTAENWWKLSPSFASKLRLAQIASPAIWGCCSSCAKDLRLKAEALQTASHH